MTKAGSGALALNGTSTYMGASSVTSGTIAGVNFINAGSSFDSNSVSTVSSGQVRVMTGGGSTSFQLSASQMATFTSQVQAQVQIRGSGLSQAEMVLLLEQITSGN